jgi:anti-sigma regulatory factor (Ser/Thr protein kinase)
MTKPVGRLRFEIRHPADLYEPRRIVRDLASAAGFTRHDGHELAIVISELISNILKYGLRGNIELEVVNGAIHILARDEGPPFHDLQLALRDGYSDRGPIDPASLLERRGIGMGLGAVVRMTDSFRVDYLTHGKEIHVVRFRTRQRRLPG